MRFLLETTDRAAEIPDLARKYADNVALRTYQRWRPSLVTSQEVRGVEWLTTRRDPERAVVLGFLHHHHYEGMFASLKRHGVQITLIAMPEAMSPDAPVQLRQHIKIMARACTMIPAVGGTQAMVDLMVPPTILGVALDVIGQTPVEFLGRRVTGSFGAARIAALSNSPVVLVTSVREGDGHYLQVHEPLEPTDFASPQDLLGEILRVLGASVLAWPEVFDTPTSRFGKLE
jgi:lauroyl/myristoyl acyltransferase